MDNDRTPVEQSFSIRCGIVCGITPKHFQVLALNYAYNTLCFCFGRKIFDLDFFPGK